MSEPPAPTNVALVYRDGRRVPVSCIYAGLDDHGTHRWMVLAPLVDLDQLEAITADTLPARTSLAVELEASP